MSLVFLHASSLGVRLTDDDSAGYVILFDAQQKLSQIIFQRPPEGWFDYVKSLKADGRAFLFFDPYDHPENGYVEWHLVTKAMMGRVLGAEFRAADIDVPETGNFKW